MQIFKVGKVFLRRYEHVQYSPPRHSDMNVVCRKLTLVNNIMGINGDCLWQFLFYCRVTLTNRVNIKGYEYS